MKRTTLVMLLALVFLALGLGSAYSQTTSTVPPDFEGTWKRSSYTATLTFRSTSITESTKDWSRIWILKSVSGDTYTYYNASDKSWTKTFSIKLENGNLIIKANTSLRNTGSDNWTSTWTKTAQQPTQQAQTNTAQQPKTNTTQQPQSQTSQTVTEADFDITQNAKGTITITGYNGKATQVVIPATIEGIRVTELGEGAFSRYLGREGWWFGADITSVTIPNSVTSIGQNAFRDCKSLTSVTIGSGVTSIGQNAFRDCKSLTSVTIGSGVTSIGDYAFYNCKSLTSVTIPNSVKTIGSLAFYECESLTSVTIPNSVTKIEGSTFSGCKSLTAITIPNSVTAIGNSAFSFTGLTSVTIPNSVTSMGYSAFSNCTSLASITIGANKNYEADAFPNNFNAYYESQGKKAGTYTWSGRLWSVK